MSSSNLVENAYLLPWYPNTPEAGAFVFRSEEEMKHIWLSHDCKPEKLPRVDFTRAMVVAVFVDAGEYEKVPSITSIKKEGDAIKILYGMHKTRMGWKVLNPSCAIVVPIVEGNPEFVLVE
jgi:hypothetical protein